MSNSPTFKWAQYIFLVLVSCASIPEEKIDSISISPTEMESIQAKTNISITSEELAHWDKLTREMFVEHMSTDGSKHRIFAYLYQAQKAFSDASGGKGSIGQISAYVVQLFFPHFPSQPSSDKFSKELSKLVEKKIYDRFLYEHAHTHKQELSPYPNCWKGEKPYFGLKVSSLQPWGLSSASEFRPSKPPAPDEPFWQAELEEVKQQMKQATEEQKKAVLYWNNEGDWKQIADTYMKGMPVQKQIEVRAAVASALFDAFIAVFDAKYAYLVRRPEQLDPKLNTLITTPNHPSYPAAHSALGAAAAAVLISYFPENQTEWERMVEEGGLSRIQAGIHFPIDVQIGDELGYKVGKIFENRK